MISSQNIFDEYLGDIKYDKDSRPGKLYPFFVRVGCVKMAAPRHERFEFLLEMGRVHIDIIFKQHPITSDELTFVFPERFMSVHEQQQFMSALTKHPDAKNIKNVDILTSSPLMISSFTREQIRILTWDDDEQHNGVV